MEITWEVFEARLQQIDDLEKERDILKVENEALRGIIEEQQRRRLEEIAELRAMQAMITDLRVEISAITEG